MDTSNYSSADLEMVKTESIPLEQRDRSRKGSESSSTPPDLVETRSGASLDERRRSPSLSTHLERQRDNNKTTSSSSEVGSVYSDVYMYKHRSSGKQKKKLHHKLASSSRSLPGESSPSSANEELKSLRTNMFRSVSERQQWQNSSVSPPTKNSWNAVNDSEDEQDDPQDRPSLSSDDDSNDSDTDEFHSLLSEYQSAAATATTSPSATNSSKLSVASFTRKQRRDMRAKVEALVRRTMPDETDNVSDMMLEFQGREEDLLEMLQALNQREATSNGCQDISSALAPRKNEGTTNNMLQQESNVGGRRHSSHKRASQTTPMRSNMTLKSDPGERPRRRSKVSGRDTQSLYHHHHHYGAFRGGTGSRSKASVGSVKHSKQQMIEFAIEAGDWDRVAKVAGEMSDARSISTISTTKSLLADLGQEVQLQFDALEEGDEERNSSTAKSSVADELDALIENDDWTAVVNAVNKYTGSVGDSLQPQQSIDTDLNGLYDDDDDDVQDLSMKADSRVSSSRIREKGAPRVSEGPSLQVVQGGDPSRTELASRPLYAIDDESSRRGPVSGMSIELQRPTDMSQLSMHSAHSDDSDYSNPRSEAVSKLRKAIRRASWSDVMKYSKLLSSLDAANTEERGHALEVDVSHTACKKEAVDKEREQKTPDRKKKKRKKKKRKKKKKHSRKTDSLKESSGTGSATKEESQDRVLDDSGKEMDPHPTSSKERPRSGLNTDQTSSKGRHRSGPKTDQTSMKKRPGMSLDTVQTSVKERPGRKLDADQTSIKEQRSRTLDTEYRPVPESKANVHREAKRVDINKENSDKNNVAATRGTKLHNQKEQTWNANERMPPKGNVSQPSSVHTQVKSAAHSSECGCNCSIM